MEYRSEIDGLRALSVIAVILFHADIELFSGGFVGVDVFFVISGFLITSIIIGEKTRQNFSLVKFYERRARRILPALFLVMLCSMLAASVTMKPVQIEDFGQSLLAVTFFVSNLLFWNETGYFEASADEKPLLHTWSLAVEEQYYVFFPLLVLVLWPLGRRPQSVVFLVLAGASLAWAEYGWRQDPTANFYLTLPRVWELLTGVLCALRMFGGPARGNNYLATLGFGAILYAIFAFDDATPYPSLFTIIPVLGTAAVLYAGAATTFVGRVLSCRIVVALGLVSYSAYLWHQPLYALARMRSVYAPSTVTMLLLGTTAFGLAYLSWRFVEQPFRRSSAVRRSTFLASTLACIGIFVSVGYYAGYSEGGAEKIYLSRLTATERQRYEVVRTGDEVGNPASLNDNGHCQFYVAKLEQQYLDRIAHCYESLGPAVVILGDSHARDLYQALTYHAETPFIVGLALGGCRPGDGQPRCIKHYDWVSNFVKDNPDLIKKIIFHQAGKWLLQDAYGHPYNVEFFKKPDMPIYAADEAAIDRTAAYLNGLSFNSEITWLGPRIEPHIDKWRIISAGCVPQALQLNGNLEKTFASLDRLLATRFTNSGRIKYVSLIDMLAFDIEQDYYDCNSLFWSNVDHWSEAGERRFGRRIISVLEDSKDLNLIPRNAR